MHEQFSLPSQSLADYETVFTNTKAGMEGVDKEHVKRVVYEMSKDSAHFKNEQRKMVQVDERIVRMKEHAQRLTAAELAASTRAMDDKLAELEAGRDLTRTWLHVDMDAFFAAVEELDNPQLAGKPFAVGSIGMISTASYAARKFGVRSAMPGFIGVKLCPELIFVKPNFDKYARMSQATRAIFRQYDPDFEAGSLDEAYLDVTKFCADHGMTGAEVAAQIRERVRQEARLTCSVGVAPNRMLAKVCSDLHKPDGQYVLEPSLGAVAAFIRTLPIRKVPGVGKVTEHTLKAFGVQTCADLIAHRGLLAALFTPVSVDFFMGVGLGLGGTEHSERPREGEVGRKGISCEQTFRPMSARAELEEKCRELAHSLAADMAAEGLRGKTLTLKLKLTSFEVRTRAQTLERHVCSGEDIYAAALRLLHAELPVELRLMGLRMSNFWQQPKLEAGQLSLEQMLQRRQQQLEREEEEEQQQQAGAAAGEAGEAGAGGSQGALSQAELVELSLRDWQGGVGAPAPAQEPPPGQERQPASASAESVEAQPGADAGSLGRPSGAEPGGRAPVGSDNGAQGPMQLSFAAQQREKEPGEGGPWEAGAAEALAPHVWACGACTFHNSRLCVRCEVCGTPRHKPQPASGRGGSSGRGSGVKRKAAKAQAAASRILLGFLTPAARHQEHQQQQQGGDPADSSPDSHLSAAAAGGGPGSASSPSPGEARSPGGALVCSLADGTAAVPQPQPSAEPRQGEAAGAGSEMGGPVEEAEEPWGGSQFDPAGGSGSGGEEDDELVECSICKEWLRYSGMREHEDWHVAVELQKKENKHAALLGMGRGGSSSGSGGKASRGGRGRGRGRGGAQPGQAALTSMLKKPRSS